MILRYKRPHITVLPGPCSCLPRSVLSVTEIQSNTCWCANVLIACVWLHVWPCWSSSKCMYVCEYMALHAARILPAHPNGHIMMNWLCDISWAEWWLNLHYRFWSVLLYIDCQETQFFFIPQEVPDWIRTSKATNKLQLREECTNNGLSLSLQHSTNQFGNKDSVISSYGSTSRYTLTKVKGEVELLDSISCNTLVREWSLFSQNHQSRGGCRGEMEGNSSWGSPVEGNLIPDASLQDVKPSDQGFLEIRAKLITTFLCKH